MVHTVYISITYACRFIVVMFSCYLYKHITPVTMNDEQAEQEEAANNLNMTKSFVEHQQQPRRRRQR